jgi:hypothetical protein
MSAVVHGILVVVARVVVLLRPQLHVPKLNRSKSKSMMDGGFIDLVEF